MVHRSAMSVIRVTESGSDAGMGSECMMDGGCGCGDEFCDCMLAADQTDGDDSSSAATQKPPRTRKRIWMSIIIGSAYDRFDGDLVGADS